MGVQPVRWCPPPMCTPLPPPPTSAASMYIQPEFFENANGQRALLARCAPYVALGKRRAPELSSSSSTMLTCREPMTGFVASKDTTLALR